MKREATIQSATGTTESVILVGTYRKDQLKKWILPKGFYNYPVAEGDSVIRAATSNVRGLWLYADGKDKLCFTASFEREISADELDGLGYPSRGDAKPHSNRYLLFKAEPCGNEVIFSEQTQRRGEDNSHVEPAKARGSGPLRIAEVCANHPGEPKRKILVRLTDFRHDAKSLAKVRYDMEAASKSQNPFSYFNSLPDDLIDNWADSLSICEGAEQLDFDWLFRQQELTRHWSKALTISQRARRLSKLTCVEICAGAGGQAIGLDMAGFEHVALVEYEPEYCEVLRTNRSDWNVICGDVRQFDGHPFRGVDLFAGGVPCPPFSVASKQLGADDERDLFPEAIRLIGEIQPRAVMLENVRGFLDPKFDDYRRGILDAIAALGYRVNIKLLNASDFGVPQLRPRVVIVGIRNDIPGSFCYPKPAEVPAPTVGEALYSLMAAKGWKSAKAWADGACKIAPTVVGGSKKHGGPDLGPARARRAWAELGVDGLGVANEAPGPDFKGSPRLTKEMLARIQGFPEKGSFGNRKTLACRMIGNAFPPPVAKAVGIQIRKVLEHVQK